MKAAFVVLLALVGGVGLAAAQIDTYPNYLNENPKVKAHTLDLLSHKEQVLFWKNVIDLETGQNISVLYPKELGKGYFLNYSSEEISAIIAAQFAHAIWLDKHGIVPWRLEDYSETDLEILFNKSSIFEILDNEYTFMIGQSMISDVSPSELFSVTKKFIKTDSNQTILALLEDFRSDFRHGLLGEPLKENSQSIFSILSDKDRHGLRVSYSGCQSMARILEASLRNLNIPAQQEYGRYAGGGHSSVYLPSQEKILLHADDIYNAGKKGMPFEAVLIDASLLDYFLKGCTEKENTCLDDALFTWEARNEMKYAQNTKYHIQHCCRRDFGYGSCSDYVENGFSNGQYLTSKEKKELLNGLLAVC